MIKSVMSKSQETLLGCDSKSLELNHLLLLSSPKHLNFSGEVDRFDTFHANPYAAVKSTVQISYAQFRKVNLLDTTGLYE